MKYQNGDTIGKLGTEVGTTLRDEKSTDGARITLEKDIKYGAPFAITFGIYGVMVTTIFRPVESEADYDFQNIKALIDIYFSDDLEDDDWFEMFEAIY